MHAPLRPWACLLTMLALAFPALAAPAPAFAEAAEAERLLLEAWAQNPEALLAEARDLEAALPKGEGAGAAAPPRSDTKDKAVLLVHGRDNYDMAGYASLRNLYLNTYGFTGGVHRVGYYGGECNVEHRAEHHGSHDKHFGGNGEHSSKTGCVSGTTQVHDLSTDIRHIAYHVAWMIREHWTTSGKAVDYVGHSMGGLLVRYAIAKEGATDFPAYLYVEDVTTFGTPHGGLGTGWCKLSPWSDVRQMCSDSSFMTWLDANAQNPQSDWATDWTLMGSDCDGWVAWNLAVDMDAAHKVVAVSPCLGHSDYYKDVGTTDNAVMDYMDKPDPEWYRCNACPHSGRWSVLASIYGSW